MRTIQSALILAASALALVAPTAEAATTRFRALPLVPEVPAAIGHPNERKALVLDVSALKKRRSDLQAARAAYRRDCENQPVNRPAHRKCQFDLVRLRRDNSRFRTDVNALRERLRRIEAAVIR